MEILGDGLCIYGNRWIKNRTMILISVKAWMIFIVHLAVWWFSKAEKETSKKIKNKDGVHTKHLSDNEIIHDLLRWSYVNVMGWNDENVCNKKVV